VQGEGVEIRIARAMKAFKDIAVKDAVLVSRELRLRRA